MELSFLILTVAALATYRLSLLVTKEQGPGKVFRKVRQVPKPKSGWRDWLSCIFCFSMTASAIVCGLLWWADLRLSVPLWFLLWCALSSITIALNQRFTKGPL